MKNLTRREFLRSMGAGLSVVGAGSLPLAACHGPAPSPAPRPNILLFLSDQERFPWHLQSREDDGRLAFTTPNRDRLREAGAVELRSHHVTSPVCSPSRGTLLTGLYPHQHGVLGNIERQPGLVPAVRTVGDRLREAGYRVGYRGKWHLSDLTTFSGPSALREFGFDDFRGGHIYGDTHVAWQGDRRNTTSAVQWIREQAGERGPWFLVVSLVNPHDIYFPMLFPRGDWAGRYDPVGPDNLESLAHLAAEKPPPHAKGVINMDAWGRLFAPRGYSEYTLSDWRRYNAFYAYLIERMDAELGRILAAVEERDPDLESTVIISTSDHGDSLGSHGLPYKGSWMYKEVLHVPMVVKFPGSQGRTVEALTSHIDVVPTICDFARVEPSGNVTLPGASLKPLLEGRTGTVHPGGIFAEGDFVDIFEEGRSDALETIITPVGDEVWKYTRYPNEETNSSELYNLTDDIRELHNRTDTSPRIGKALRSRLDDWYESTPPDANLQAG